MSNGLIRATLFAALAVVTMPIQCGEIHHCQATIHGLFAARPMLQKILNRLFIFQLVIQANPLKNAGESINIRLMKANRSFNFTLAAMMASAAATKIPHQGQKKFPPRKPQRRHKSPPAQAAISIGPGPRWTRLKRTWTRLLKTTKSPTQPHSHPPSKAPMRSWPH
jgi:hypothetical protein